MMFVHGMGLLVNTFYLALYWYYSNKKVTIPILVNFNWTILKQILNTSR